MTPRVSILIPSHRPDFLAEAMQSVWRQTEPGWELLVAYEHAPLNERLNRMAEAARGEYLVVLADDDWLHPDFLTAMLATVVLQPEIDVVYSNVRCVGPDYQGVATMASWSLNGFKKGPACWLTSMVRRQVWLDVGGHVPSLSYHDWDFWYRCFKAGAQAAHLDAVLWSHREHTGQWTHAVKRPAALEEIFSRHPELR